MFTPPEGTIIKEWRITCNSQSNPELHYAIICALIERENRKYLSMRCDCPASDFKETVCKHEKAILDGDYSMLSTSEDVEIGTIIHGMFKHTDFGPAYAEYANQVEALVKQEKRIKAEISKIKKAAREEIGQRLAVGAEYSGVDHEK